METKEVIKDCMTCLYMATHEECNDCLYKPGEYQGEFHYYNYKEGNWMKRLMAAELEGRRDIVIGGQGEAEVNVKTPPKDVCKNLQRIAEQCGYYAESLRKDQGLTCMRLWNESGVFDLVWDSEGLKAIYKCDHEGKRSVETDWDREACKVFVEKMSD